MASNVEAKKMIAAPHDSDLRPGASWENVRHEWMEGVVEHRQSDRNERAARRSCQYRCIERCAFARAASAGRRNQ